jgi:hypothetical protein
MVFYQQYEMGTGQVISVPLDLEFVFAFAKYYSSCSFDAYPTMGENMKKLCQGQYMIDHSGVGWFPSEPEQGTYVELIT